MCGIYKITNIANSMSYIGQSINILQRWREERFSAFNSNSASYYSELSKAFREFAVNAEEVKQKFKFEVLEECDRALLDEREEYWADYYNTYVPYGYNVAICGQNTGSFCGKLSSKEVLEIINLLKNTKLTNIEIAKLKNLKIKHVSQINVGVRNRLPGIEYPVRKTKKEPQYCLTCGKLLKRTNRSGYCCDDCRWPLPEYETFVKDVYEKGIEPAAKDYNCSRKLIKRWLKKYNLPESSTEFRAWYRETYFPKQKKKVFVVEKYDLQGNFIAEYKTPLEAGASVGRGPRKYNHIIDCYNGKLPQAYGYIWKKREL